MRWIQEVKYLIAEGILKLNDLLPHHLTAFTVWFQLICFTFKTVLILYGATQYAE